jgi:broad specificity phosphatase PhoE
LIVGVRHGRVWNPDGVVYASLPGFHLSEDGRREAEDLATALSAAPVRAVHASPLDRAQETASILAAPHGLTVRTDRRLSEWSFWQRWQGINWERLRERDPELLDAYAADPAGANPDDPLEAAGERLLRWAAEVEAEREHGEGLVIGVGHEAPLVAAYLVGSGRSLASFHRHSLAHLGAVRLRPGPAEMVDLVAWAASC